MKLIQRTRPKWMAEKALATETQRDYEPINSKTISSVCIIGSLVCYVVRLKEYTQTHTLRHSYFMRMDSLHQQKPKDTVDTDLPQKLSTEACENRNICDAYKSERTTQNNHSSMKRIRTPHFKYTQNYEVKKQATK